MDDPATRDLAALLGRLVDAVNAHDLDALVACFAPGYRNETPAHPARGFTGSSQVRSNWGRMFAGIPDLGARVLSQAIDGGTAWTEWELRGTRVDGARQLMRGVMIFTAADGLLDCVRLYLEPVDEAGGDVDAAIELIAGAAAAPEKDLP
ncbi:nuclear transport factor 2 family protein [Paeniglutamicibacter sp. ABSL32-1]|uniref:nuclear transport factor 2 family protein n=1 Tax=Paeniglutamicibacter quisquiliarum TaxID=2849498 RepID=UPI001C2DB905|nr:nuclear transport factor 2 family protein [Paeniglutamicibacter quisquiliarum]MBV1778263.1 nuclear transport factor 2 family protein [Paeniglutamicibacter quisquiliarum]